MFTSRPVASMACAVPRTSGDTAYSRESLETPRPTLLTALLVVGLALPSCASPEPRPKTADKGKSTKLATLPIDDPREPEAEEGRPRAALSAMARRVGGFSFGMTFDEAAALCRSARGEAITTDDRGVRGLGCTVAPVKAEFELDGVVVSFCDGRACEISLVPTGSIVRPTLTQRTDQLTQVARVLDGKYGPPMYVQGSTEDLARIVGVCGSGQKVRQRRSWFWPDEGRKTVTARLVFAYDCEPRPGGVRDSFTILYQDEAGWQRWMQEHRQRKDSY